MEPTPRPWRAYEQDDGQWAIRDRNNVRVASELLPDQATIIVRAVNSFDDLLEALKEAMAHGTVNCPPWVGKARIAIAKAEGREPPSV